MRDLGELYLRRFVAARKVGDETAMRENWNGLVTVNFDRVVGMVRSESWGHLDDHEREDAVQEALVRLTRRVIWTFEGTAMGQWVNTAKRAVYYACVDVQNAAKRVHDKERSYDDTWTDDEGEERGAWSAALFAEAEARRAAEEEALEDLEEVAADRDFLSWAKPQLSNKLREVVEADLAGVPVEEMAARLGLEPDAIYQRRRRAILKLRELRKSYPS